MKRALFLVSAVLLFAGPAIADHIGLFGDAGATQCFLTPAFAPQTNYVYVVHTNNPGSTGSQFRVWNDIVGVLAVSMVTPHGVTGGIYEGAGFLYGGCISGNVLVATLGFLWFGVPLTCDSRLYVIPDPTADPDVLVTYDCNSAAKAASGGGFVLQPACTDDCHPLPVQSTTWGSVKALYR